jgi:hypothetical protein
VAFVYKSSTTMSESLAMNCVTLVVGRKMGVRRSLKPNYGNLL